MNSAETLIVTPGIQLRDAELQQINEAIHREFNVAPMQFEEFRKKLFFLLKENEDILAMGALQKIEPVYFNDETFSFYSFLNIVANKKGKGYGRTVVESMRDYVIQNDVTGFGFCMPKNSGFYEKCRFRVETKSTQRFVYLKDGKRITNQDGQVIFYQESSANFMEKVLAQPDKDVFIPTDGLW